MTEETGVRRWLHGWRRRVAISVAVAVGTIAIGAVIGTLLVSGTPSGTRSAAIARLEPIAPGAVVLAQDASPDELDEPLGMGSQHAGVAVLAVSDVDEVRTPAGRRRASEGSTLLAFQVGDWACEVQPCTSWTTLEPSIVVDGESQELPEGGDTFVVVLPPGSEDVELTIDADGYAQSVSLSDESAGAGNIVLLATKDTEERTPLGQTYRLGERTSIVLDDGAGRQSDLFERDVTVAYAQLRFFLGSTTPSSPRRAFLVVNAYYSYAGRQPKFVFAPGEAVFVGEDGTRYDARDLDPSEGKALLGFEVPATLRSGTFVVGGTTEKTSTTGVAYTSTLQELRLPIEVG